uniref:Bm14377 n=1 Tax=Brugia malayi TaxID=6279 RepID=A0A1I9G7G2_BRUMA|nr:Bm14377 [Brugia malayi]
MSPIRFRAYSIRIPPRCELEIRQPCRAFITSVACRTSRNSTNATVVSFLRERERERERERAYC